MLEVLLPEQACLVLRDEEAQLLAVWLCDIAYQQIKLDITVRGMIKVT